MKTSDLQKEVSKSAQNNSGIVKAKSDAASGLKDLFEDGIKDIYWAEKALSKALPKMAKNATTRELKDAINNHLVETHGQIKRIETAFEIIGVKPIAKKCDAMEGLIKECEGIMEETEMGIVRDAGIIAAGQKIEHYEIATYGTLRQFATTLGFDEVADLFQLSLDEEKNADVSLTEIAVNSINIEAEKVH